MTDQHKEVQLPQGTIRYREVGEGKPIVFVHGYMVDHRLWDGVVDNLSDRFRCIAPDWPLAAHQVPMNADADLSPPGVARLISDFLTKLELEDVTIVGNDSGGAMSQVLVTTHPDRIGRLVLTNCDTHENFPPGPFKVLPPVARMPGGMFMISLPFRIEAIARLAFGPFTKTKIPNDLIASWMEPAKKDSKILRDAGKVTAGMNKRYTLAAAEKLRSSQLPIRLLWAPDDRVFPLSYAKRLAGESGNAELVQISDARTFVSLDQPKRVAEEIAEFAASS